MNGNNFASIRRIFWLGIGVAVVLAGCDTTTVAPTALPTPAITPDVGGQTRTVSYATPAITPAIDKKIETPLPAATPTAPALPTANIRVVTPVPSKSPTASPTVQHNTPTLEPTPTPIPTFLAACPTPIPASSITHRDGNTGWRHYWASSSQSVAVYDLLVDGKWLWIATTKGMIRLNQHSLEYQLYPSTDTSPDITLNQVYTLAVDDQGRLWAGGEHGLVRYTDGAGWKVIYTGEQVTSFALDNEGNLWYWNRQDYRHRPWVYRFQGQDPPAVGDWQPLRTEWQESYLDPNHWHLLAIRRRDIPVIEQAKDAKGNTWYWEYRFEWTKTSYNRLVVTRNDRVVYVTSSSQAVAVAEAGIWIGLSNGLFYGDGQTLKRYRFAAGKAMIDDYPDVYDLAFTADGSGWATTSEGLFRFSDGTGKWERITQPSRPFEEKGISLAASGQQNGLWVYGPEYYLAYFNGQSWQHFTLPDNVIQRSWMYKAAAIEYQGDFWFAGSNRGLFRFDGQTWKTSIYTEIKRLARDRKERLYAIDDNDSVIVYDGTNWQRLPDCAECSELGLPGAMSVDATGKVWVVFGYSSDQGGIWRYSSDQGWCKILMLNPYTYVRSLLIDAYGDPWLLYSHTNTVSHCDRENCEVLRFTDDQPFDAPITAIAKDLQGRIWVGGYGLLSVYDPAAER